MPDVGDRRKPFRKSRGLAILLVGYALAAYVLAPEIWRASERLWGGSPNPMLTRTTADIPGDPINIGLVGSKAEVIRAFATAGWDTADAITLATSVEIGLAVLFDRPFPDAPVSTLLFDGRPQTFAFEKPVGHSPDRRHHVRLWLTSDRIDGREYWLGAASLDIGSGLSHDTGQVTHHIGPDVDTERDLVITDLTNAASVARSYDTAGSGATQDGRNGGGDRYVTDGKVRVVVLAAEPSAIAPKQ